MALDGEDSVGGRLWMRFAAAALVLALALGLRLRGMAQVPWYTDEGAVAEVAGAWAHGQGPAVGAIRQSAFFPLTASPLAPLTAALFARWHPGGSLPGLRLWAACLGSLEAACLLGLAWTWLGPLGGLAAGLAAALNPLAVSLQQMGFYHHFGALLSLACLALLDRYRRAPGPSSALALGLACGLAAASAYWLLWLLPLPGVAALSLRRPKDLAWCLPALALPLVLVAAWSLRQDPGGFWGDLKDIGRLSDGQVPLPVWLRPFYGLGQALRAYPSLGLGLAGLAGWAWRDRGAAGRRGVWVLGWSLACGAEIFRQRQNLDGFSYPLILVLPAAALGLAFLAAQAWDWRKAGPVRVAAALAVVPALAWSLSRPAPLPWLRQASAPPADSEELLAEIRRLAAPGDLVLGQPGFNWALAGSGIQAAELEQASMWEGASGTFQRSVPAQRYAFDPSLARAKLLVLGPYSYGVSFSQPGPRRLGLRVEMGGWPKLWSNATYDLYGNPDRGFPRAQAATALLKYYNLYDQAALEAVDRKDWAAARWALIVGSSSKEGDVLGRLRLLAQVQAVWRKGGRL